MNLLERVKTLASKVDNGIENAHEIVNDCEEELEEILSELLKSDWKSDFKGTLEILKIASKIPDPEDPSTMLYMLGANLYICAAEITSPDNITQYLLKNGHEESESVTVNGIETTIIKLMEFYEFLEFKKTSIGISFITEGKINDGQLSGFVNIFEFINQLRLIKE
jgi:hypothetical protein